MKILGDFIRDNRCIEILSNGGHPLEIPAAWGRVLGESDILVVIPDMHMHRHGSELDSFSEGAAAMVNFLMHLENLKLRLLLAGKTLRVIQMGDLYAQGTQINAIIEINGSHRIYGQITKLLKDLAVTRLFGDADFGLRECPYCRYSFRLGAVHLEHGFVADFFEPHWSLACIREAAIAELLLHETMGGEYSCTRNGKDPTTKVIGHFCRVLDQPENSGVRICVVGHSHKPQLFSNLSLGEQILIDAGAWTDGRTDFAVITNDEVAVCGYRRY
jgi:hypothetical protein